MKKMKALSVGLLGFVVLVGAGCERQGSAGGEWENWFSAGTEGSEKIGGTAQYVVEDGVLTGTTVEGSPNTFLCRGPYGDFELEFDYLVY